MPMTIKQIIANSTRDRILLSREVSVTNVKVVRHKPTGRPLASSVTFSPYHPTKGHAISKPPRYETRVLGTDPDKPWDGQYVEVDCTCGDFWSHWEYALNRKGAAQIRRSNGEPPIQTNPQQVPGVCKHVIALFRHLTR